MKKILTSSLLALFLSSCLPGPEKLIPKSFFGSGNSSGNTSATETPELLRDTLSCEETRFVTLLNLYRKKNNLGPLDVSEAGVEEARWHAKDMSDKNYFSHTELDGRTFAERTLAFGHNAWSENIAAGYTSADATFCQWKNSSSHNNNMLRADHKTIGIGQYVGSGIYKSYWVNVFGPEVQDKLSLPYTDLTKCSLPQNLPSC